MKRIGGYQRLLYIYINLLTSPVSRDWMSYSCLLMSPDEPKIAINFALYLPLANYADSTFERILVIETRILIEKSG